MRLAEILTCLFTFMTLRAFFSVLCETEFYGLEGDSQNCGSVSVSFCGELDQDDFLVPYSGQCNVPRRMKNSFHVPKNNESKSTWQLFNFPNGSIGNFTGAFTRASCRLTVCDDENVMGYCFHVEPGSDIKNSTQAEWILQSPVRSALCSCNNNDNPNEIWQASGDDHFDRHFVGVVYNPYDRKWVEGNNGRSIRYPLINYTDEDIRASLKVVATNFREVSTFGQVGTGTSISTIQWPQNHTLLVARTAGQINAEVGFLALRLTLGVSADSSWTSVLDAGKDANKIFPGTVWGITVMGNTVWVDLGADEALKVIRPLKARCLEAQLKVGVTLWQDISPSNISSSEVRVAKEVDYMILTHNPQILPDFMEVEKLLALKKKRFDELTVQLKQINSNLRLIFATGLPSGNGNREGVKDYDNFTTFWYEMARFAKNNHTILHMLEAFDQPHTCDQYKDSGTYETRYGPNCQYGWWERYNNSAPPVYLPKAQMAGNMTYRPGFRTSTYPPRSNNEEVGVWESIWKTPKVIVGIILGVVAIAIVSNLLFWRKLRNTKRNVISQAYVEQFLHGGEDNISIPETNYAVALKMPYDRKYELLKENFQLDKLAVMGSGESGVVVRGTIRNLPYSVVFKCSTPSSTVMDIKHLMSEIKILAYIGKHDYVVSLLGAYTKKIQRGIVYVALEFCPLGSLENILPKIDSAAVTKGLHEETLQCSSSLTSPNYVTVTTLPVVKNDYNVQYELEDRVKKVNSFSTLINLNSFLLWSHQIATAMEFLAEKKVIHADLATRNVLLMSPDHVKVSDFGLSKKLYQDMEVNHDKSTPLPWRWMAPESLTNLTFSIETDVWAYGVTVWEIFSLGEVPYHGTSYDMDFVERLGQGMRLPRPKFLSQKIFDTILSCWNITPRERPDFTHLKQYFKALVETDVTSL